MMQLSTQPSPARPHHFGPPIKPLAALPDRPQGALDALEELGSIISVRKNAEIWAQGDSVQYSYRIVSGCIRLVKLMEDGRRQISEFLVAGDWFGFGCSALQDVAAEAVAGSVLKRYPRRAVDALASHDISVAQWRFELMSQKFYRAQEHLLTLGRRTAEERIASFLLAMAGRTERDRSGLSPLPMNRTDIADYLGLRLETICRVLSRLKRAGAIRVAPSGQIRRRNSAGGQRGITTLPGA
jgi:CRP/FNR family nitrogen fixation transcriptional regulator